MIEERKESAVESEREVFEETHMVKFEQDMVSGFSPSLELYKNRWQWRRRGGSEGGEEKKI